MGEKDFRAKNGPFSKKNTFLWFLEQNKISIEKSILVKKIEFWSYMDQKISPKILFPGQKFAGQKEKINCGFGSRDRHGWTQHWKANLLSTHTSNFFLKILIFGPFLAFLGQNWKDPKIQSNWPYLCVSTEMDIFWAWKDILMSCLGSLESWDPPGSS